MNKVMRYQIADYLKVNGKEGTAAYALMGTGFTSLNESPTPKVDTQAYISDKNAPSTTTGYENSFSYDTQFIADEAAVAALMRVGHDQLTGEDTMFTYCRVDLYDPVEGEQNVFNAREFLVSVEPGDVSGEATEVVTTSGVLHQCGDFVKGTFDTTTKMFTPD